jgi:undecaprenyl diphosphate synthase
MKIKPPNHIAIIPDGNRRWARKRGLSVFEGHRRGFERGTEIVKKAREMNIKILTFWAFSTENWNRSKEEVNDLMKLYQIMIEKNLKQALKEKSRIIHLGRKDRIDGDLRKKIINAEEKTKNFNKYYFCLALDYGGRDEVVRAIKKISDAKNSKLNIDEETFNQFLDTKILPHPNVDLVIRTSGEQRSSGFMIWQTTYSEYIFYEKYFPDFSAEDLEKCIKEYQKRRRRFGK